MYCTYLWKMHTPFIYLNKTWIALCFILHQSFNIFPWSLLLLLYSYTSKSPLLKYLEVNRINCTCVDLTLLLRPCARVPVGGPYLTCTSGIVFIYEHLCATQTLGINVTMGLLQSSERLIPGVPSDHCEHSNNALISLHSNAHLEVILYSIVLQPEF